MNQNLKQFNKLSKIIQSDFESSIENDLGEFYYNKKDYYLNLYSLREFDLLIVFKHLYTDLSQEFETPFDSDLTKLVIENNKIIQNMHLLDFECVGFMNATDGKNDFSMFLNENSRNPAGGGFQWSFYDFDTRTNPSIDMEKTGVIFVHMNSLEKIKEEAIKEEKMYSNKLKEIIRSSCEKQLRLYSICSGCLEKADINGNCKCMRECLC